MHEIYASLSLQIGAIRSAQESRRETRQIFSRYLRRAQTHFADIKLSGERDFKISIGEHAVPQFAYVLAPFSIRHARIQRS